MAMNDPERLSLPFITSSTSSDFLRPLRKHTIDAIHSPANKDREQGIKGRVAFEKLKLAIRADRLESKNPGN